MSEIKHEYDNGWIGVDFDGTLCEYHGWKGELTFGAPIATMVDRVKDWIRNGQTVKIVTARAEPQFDIPLDYSFGRIKEEISIWCMDNIGTRLEVVSAKDYCMSQLWDDRAVQVELNTGEPVVEKLRAEIAELKAERDEARINASILRIAGMAVSRAAHGDDTGDEAFGSALGTCIDDSSVDHVSEYANISDAIRSYKVPK